MLWAASIGGWKGFGQQGREGGRNSALPCWNCPCRAAPSPGVPAQEGCGAAGASPEEGHTGKAGELGLERGRLRAALLVTLQFLKEPTGKMKREY